MKFEFATAGRIVFGPGAFAGAGALARDLGRRALVVAGRDIRRTAPLVRLLERAGVASVIFSVPGEPEIATVQNGAALAKMENCDFVIGFGGGSALDAGKGIAALMMSGGDLLDYLEVIGRGLPLTRPSAPFMAIPTTAGTGTEVTRNAVLASPAHRTKASLRSAFLLPLIALVDPDLTLDLPPSITASSGLDALTQLIEPFVTPRANPLTDALCREGIPRVARSLRLAFKDGYDARAREDMSLAALFGGLALANAGLGAVHGLANPIGGMFPAPHGVICAALLGPVMEANCKALQSREPSNPAWGRYLELACLLTGRPDATVRDGVDWVARLVSDLGTPGLGSFGLGAGHAGELAERGAKASSMKANPIALSRDELTGILTGAL